MTSSVTVSQLQPLAGYVLVELTPTPKQTESGIYLPDSYKEDQQFGSVLAVGNAEIRDGQTIEAQVKKGDKVLFKQDKFKARTELKFGDKEYVFLSFGDLLAVVKK